MKTLEHEKKLLLAPSEYEILISALSHRGAMIQQTNYYYDTSKLDGNISGVTYRIREKDGRFIATVKGHRADGKDGSTEWSGEVKAWDDISFFANPALDYQGCLITERLVVHPSKQIEIAVDKNHYCHCTDYELEIEYSDGAEAEAKKVLCNIAELLRQNGKPTSASSFMYRLGMSQNKSERFFARKMRKRRA